MGADHGHLELLARIASEYYLEHQSQRQIADQLGYSRSMISRLLREAEEQGVVEIRVHYPLERCPAQEAELRSKLGLAAVQVLARGSLGYDQMLRRLGALAARMVEELVTEDMQLGVSWGTALREVSNALSPHGYTGVKVIQIIGALDTPDPEIDGPDLARNLARLFGGQYYTLPAPLILEAESTRDALMSDPRVRRILSLTEKLQMALVGIGTVAPAQSSLLRAGYLSSRELDDLTEAGAVGDVCAIHIDIRGNILDVPLHKRRIGISPEDFVKIPIKVGVAGGEEKARSIVGACRAGLVNYLITDETAALAALREIQGDKPV